MNHEATLLVTWGIGVIGRDQTPTVSFFVTCYINTNTVKLEVYGNIGTHTSSQTKAFRIKTKLVD